MPVRKLEVSNLGVDWALYDLQRRRTASCRSLAQSYTMLSVLNTIGDTNFCNFYPKARRRLSPFIGESLALFFSVYQSGTPNDDFLLHTLKTLFRLSKVLLRL